MAASEKEFKAYLRFLWKEGLKTNWKGKGNIRCDLSNEKSAVYAAISDKFRSKWLLWLCDGIVVGCTNLTGSLDKKWLFNVWLRKRCLYLHMKR